MAQVPYDLSFTGPNEWATPGTFAAEMRPFWPFMKTLCPHSGLHLFFRFAECSRCERTKEPDTVALCPPCRGE